MGKTTIESLEKVIRKHARGYLTSFEDIDSVAKDFWDKKMPTKIKKWYIPQKDDIILTASFDIIMYELFRRLSLTDSVCSEYNRKTMQAEYINFSSNKPIRFREKFGDATVDEFYTDSMFDAPMIEMAKKAYLVKKDKITQIK